MGLNLNEDFLDFCRGFTMRIRILRKRATTPPSLFGIERRIAYANRKYHSGWMWVGVLMGLAGIKFSGSVDIYGEIKIAKENNLRENTTPRRSLEVKNG